MSQSSPATAHTRRGSTLAALIIGLPAAACLVALFRLGPLRQLHVARYVEWPVQWAVVAFFCVACAALLVKWLRLRVEFDAFDRGLLPGWDGKAVPVTR